MHLGAIEKSKFRIITERICAGTASYNNNLGSLMKQNQHHTECQCKFNAN